MNAVLVEQKSYEMPPRDGFTVAHFLTVADIDRSLRFYETVFGGRALSRGDSKGAPGYIQIANTWLLVKVGGGPTPDKPSVTSTARRVATSAILTVILSRSDKARPSRTVNAWRG
jgi:catechol 2,3-dioxygenase-like lactoylglutathione lyase family enzyme